MGQMQVMKKVLPSYICLLVFAHVICANQLSIVWQSLSFFANLWRVFLGLINKVLVIILNEKLELVFSFSFSSQNLCNEVNILFAL